MPRLDGEVFLLGTAILLSSGIQRSNEAAISAPWSLLAGGVLVSSGWSPTIPILVATDSENGVVVVGKPAEKSRRDTISSAAPLRLISAAECIRFQYGSRHRCIRACSISYSRWEASFHMEFICSSVHFLGKAGSRAGEAWL